MNRKNERIEEIMNDIFTDENLCLVRDALENQENSFFDDGRYRLWDKQNIRYYNEGQSFDELVNIKEHLVNEYSEEIDKDIKKLSLGELLETFAWEVHDYEGKVVEVVDEDNNFEDSYEDNDEIGSIIREELGDDYEVFVDYHILGDGKHRVFIDDTEAFDVNAWNTIKDLKEFIEEWKENEKGIILRIKGVVEDDPLFEYLDGRNIDWSIEHS